MLNSNYGSIVLTNVLTACWVVSEGKAVLPQYGTLQVAQLHVDRMYMEVKQLVQIVGTSSDSLDWKLTRTNFHDGKSSSKDYVNTYRIYTYTVQSCIKGELYFLLLFFLSPLA